MRLLFIHSKPFSFHVTEKTKYAEPIEDGGEVLERGSAENALVVFCAAEAPDEEAPGRVASTAAHEIGKAFETVGAKTVVLYPYSHLSNNLCSPHAAIAILKKLRTALAPFELINAPFGWYKAFEMHGAGHPVSELSRVIEIEPSEIARASARGKEHPLCALNQRFREIFLDLGLDEVVNPAIVEDTHVYKQYGPEAPLILDRVFYLAGLDRADIGLSKSKEQKLLEIVPDFNRWERLQSLMRDYKEAVIEADDFFEQFALQLMITGEQAAEIFEKVFPEFKDLKPVPTNKTLRSHMTSNWFPVLGNVRSRLPLPVRLFSVGSRFRREQRQDPTHLFESTSASVVVMDKGLIMDDGKKLTRQILNKLGFDKTKFVKKKVASRYYDPETDTEVFIKYKGQDIEIGNLGFYAPASCARYGIDLPVFNIGFGVERMAMMLSGGDDIRALVYPLLYETVNFDDKELAGLLGPKEAPQDQALAAAAKSMGELAAANSDAPGPAQVELYSGPLGGKPGRITIFNWDQGKPMLSHAALNEVFVHQGNVYGLPRDASALGDKFRPIYDEGVNTGLRFIDLIAAGFAARAEAHALAGKAGPLEERWKIAKHPAQVNLGIPDAAYDFIQRLHKTIKVGGPLFFGVRAEWD